jgi:SAM-dependent methyltransferase
VDTPADLAVVAWGAQVRANREQVDRIREVGDGDFYATTTGLFQADPRRPDAEDATLAALRGLVGPGETWLDIGAGAGRYAMPLALAVGPAGQVIAVETSAAMLAALRDGLVQHDIGNDRIVDGRWPLGEGVLPVPAGDVALIAHVGYDIEAIGPFLEAMERAARREYLAVLMERSPASLAEAFWPPIHGEPRIALPALPAFVDLLHARGRGPSVELVESSRRRWASRTEVEAFIRRQTWVATGSTKDRRMLALLDEWLVETADGGVELTVAEPLRIGLVAWQPG